MATEIKCDDCGYAHDVGVADGTCPFCYNDRSRWSERELFSIIHKRLMAIEKTLSSRDSSAGTPEIDLCVTCKQRPCGCKKAMCKCPKPYSIGGVLCSYCGNHLREEEPADKPCEHESKYVVSGYVSQNDVSCVICSACSTVGKRFDDGKIEWWPSPTPTAPEDPVPPWEAMNKSLDEWMCDYCGTEATRGIDFLIAQRDALRSRQNDKAKEVLKELQGLVNANRYHAGWIDAKLASLGGA